MNEEPTLKRVRLSTMSAKMAREVGYVAPELIVMAPKEEKRLLFSFGVPFRLRRLLVEETVTVTSIRTANIENLIGPLSSKFLFDNALVLPFVYPNQLLSIGFRNSTNKQIIFKFDALGDFEVA